MNSLLAAHPSPAILDPYITLGSRITSQAVHPAGLCYGAIGTDTAGSVRIPAAFCGVVGCKPTYGRVSNRGVIPLRPSLDHVGPLTRSVADSGLLLQALAGYDPDDITSADVPVPNYGVEALASRKVRVRLGVPRRLFYDQLSPDIEKVVHQALAVLGQFSQSTQDVELPELTMLPVAPTGAEIYAYHGNYMARNPELYQEETLLRLRGTVDVSAPAYIEAIHSIGRLSLPPGNS